MAVFVVSGVCNLEKDVFLISFTFLDSEYNEYVASSVVASVSDGTTEQYLMDMSPPHFSMMEEEEIKSYRTFTQTIPKWCVCVCVQRVLVRINVLNDDAQEYGDYVGKLECRREHHDEGARYLAACRS